MIVGRLGAEAIGAVDIGRTFFFTAAVFGGGMLLGLDIVVAQAFGAGRLDDGHRVLVQGGSTWSCPPAPRAPKNSANGFPTSRQENDLDSRIRDSRPGILSDSRSRAPRPGSDQRVDRSRGARRDRDRPVGLVIVLELGERGIFGGVGSMSYRPRPVMRSAAHCLIRLFYILSRVEE